MTPWAVPCQASFSMGFSRQEYWNGLPFPLPGDLPNLGIESMSLLSSALVGCTSEPPGKLRKTMVLLAPNSSQVEATYISGSKDNLFAQSCDQVFSLNSGCFLIWNLSCTPMSEKQV